ncbi:DUF6884 domain-containing protein [Sulfurovum sp.]|uniref:DUF6884 domain-containing protein n=1 Tax=Sulfurovum sp. TaxID=1969726 RepID=UPI003564ADC5
MINLITSCTNSKKHSSSELLKIANYDVDSTLEDVIAQWKYNLSKNSYDSYKAKELYKGGAWQAVRETYNVLSKHYNTELFIASAGHGLIHSDNEINAYDCTFASNTSNSISKFVKDSNKRANINWWNEINTFSVSSFSDGSLFFIVLPHGYLYATQGFIKELIERFGKDVFIFTASQHSILPFMEDNIVKFDSRFNNFQIGVISNMLQRAVLWLSNEIMTKHIPLSHAELQNHIDNEMAQHELFTMPVRAKLTEEDIREKIKTMIVEDNIASASQGLRSFRDKGFACEQKRFGKLFKQVKGELT